MQKFLKRSICKTQFLVITTPITSLSNTNFTFYAKASTVASHLIYHVQIPLYVNAIPSSKRIFTIGSFSDYGKSSIFILSIKVQPFLSLPFTILKKKFLDSLVLLSPLRINSKTPLTKLNSLKKKKKASACT
jgi:hypothetical protein